MKTISEREYKKQGLTYNQYANIHMYLAAHFKKSGTCFSCGATNNKRTEWALKVGEKYSKDINDYNELCVSCHRKQDYTDAMRVENSNRFKKYYKTGKIINRLPLITRDNSPTNKIVLQIDLITGDTIKEFPSVTVASLAMRGKVTGAINNCIKGLSKKAYKYKWRFKNV